jgi:hypothetical protein
MYLPLVGLNLRKKFLVYTDKNFAHLLKKFWQVMMMIHELRPHLTPEIFSAEVNYALNTRHKYPRKTLSQSNETNDKQAC